MVYSQKLARFLFGWSLFWLHQKIGKEKSAVAIWLKVELFNNIVWKIYEWSSHSEAIKRWTQYVILSHVKDHSHPK